MDAGRIGLHKQADSQAAKQWRCQGPEVDSLCQSLCCMQTTKRDDQVTPEVDYNMSAGVEGHPLPSSQNTEDLSQLRGDVCQAIWLTKQVGLQQTIEDISEDQPYWLLTFL